MISKIITILILLLIILTVILLYIKKIFDKYRDQHIINNYDKIVEYQMKNKLNSNKYTKYVDKLQFKQFCKTVQFYKILCFAELFSIGSFD